ncbi:MAG: PAS domain S-box protein, partial [Betaproteobacteria bacterium]|nr:PAS domain S-box protein [Betaproteobacteria bacterium]
MSEPPATASPNGNAEATDSTATPTDFPVIGIGASAGGLAAIEAFFSGMPADADTDMAFVLVQHLAPDHKSLLSELVRRYTRMQVFEVEDGMVVQPNCTYIIPPNRDMAFINGRLQLLEPAAPRGQRLPVDFFFRSLAQDQRERAIGIVLSGTGSDGTLGARAIKGEAGMVMAQKPESTEFDGMPRSTIAAGVVDYVLPPAEMPAQLIAYATHAYGQLPRLLAPSAPQAENAMQKIFVLLRAQTGHDFSQYKPSTIERRIARRMAVHQIEAIDSYVKYLQQTPVEVQALFRDLLIGVTSFFRDPEAFQALKDQGLPKLLVGKPPGSVIRVWSAGCSTGEEAYSIAILFQELVEALGQNCTAQIFATDIDSLAVASARAGLFPLSIAADITPERLARFFAPEADNKGYRIHKHIRDMLVFSEQDLIKDPPFSKLDLISCRNLLIYLNVELQQRLIPLFHYALNPGGLLLLGNSESVGDFGELFTVLDRSAKLYQRQEGFQSAQRLALARFTPLLPTPGTKSQPADTRPGSPAKRPLRALVEQALLQQVVPAAALVSGQGDVLYLHGHTGLFLEPSPGEAGINNILKMAREGLKPALTNGLRQAVISQQAVRSLNLRVKTNGHFSGVNLGIVPVLNPAAPAPAALLYLVAFDEVPAPDAAAPDAAAPDAAAPDARIAALQRELRAKDEYLQTSREELESANEELKSSNEEMQSVNEELQSTNEELETSKEELQSVAEELSTVNAELQSKVLDLSRVNNDMNNLLAGTGIATVFVDPQLRLLRFTPASTQVINLILSDIGRPIGHIVSNLAGYDSLAADIRGVLDSLVTHETAVQTLDGLWFLLRILPYRTLDNVIEGAVITFVEISALRRTQDELREANQQLLRMAVVVRDANDAVTVIDLSGRILAWNPAATRIYGWTEAEALQLNNVDRVPATQRQNIAARLRELMQARTLAPYRDQRLAKDGGQIDVWITATALVNEQGEVYAVA